MPTRPPGSDPPDAPSAGVAMAPPPPTAGRALYPALLESYVRAAMHGDRAPGTLVAVSHPLRTYRVPSGLLDALRGAGWSVDVVDTAADRVESVRRIRDALLRGAEAGAPLDVLVFSGDGSLDHHVLVAAFLAFCPELVSERPGAVSVQELTREDRVRVPVSYREAFLSPLPDGAGIEPSEANVHRIWRLRGRIAPLLRREARPGRIARRAGLAASDPMLRIAVLAALLPHRVTLRPHGFDLAGLANASREQGFQGLYPHIRSIAVYPAGTAADNALYAGVPGWAYARVAGVLDRFELLGGFKRWWQERLTRRFVEFFTREAVVVPARFSIIGFDGDWQVISSHAAGGPGGGHFFAADLASKTGGLLGYMARIPSVLLRVGFFEHTVMRLHAYTASGRTKVKTEGRLVEGLYTNRAFIAGIGSVPSTNPTSFAGQSSLVVAPPLVYRDAEGAVQVDLSGLFTFTEAVVKGLLGRLMHGLGLGVGRLAGGGRFSFLAPEHQITLGEGEGVDIDYLGTDGHPVFVPTQVSGDPFQASRMSVRVAWGPLPLLAAPDSLLLAAAQRSLARLRQQQTWNLDTVFIGGWPCYRHLVGPEWNASLSERTGLFAPPHHLPWRLDRAQPALLRRWRALGTGGFVDTTEQGLALGRRGRYAHNSEHTAHLMLLRESRRALLVRQVRRAPDGEIFEARTRYRAGWGGWVIQETQTRVWRSPSEARLVQEERFFRGEQDFMLEAPSFFPFIHQADDDLIWAEVTDEYRPGAE